MKKIISLLIAVTILLGAFSINALAAESTSLKKQACYRIKWSDTSFYTYAYNEKKTDGNYEKYFDVEKTSRYIYSTGTTSYEGSGGGRAYVSQRMFAINDSTQYEYIFKAKNNIDQEYAGIVFAFGGGLPYIMYGSFNNTGASPNVGVSSFKLTKGFHASSSKDCSTGYNERFLKIALDDEGFGHYKIVYNGFKVSVYAITDIEDGVYSQLGSSITLPSDSKVALGVYARTEAEANGPNRTVNLSDCLLYAMNSEAKQNLASYDDGTSRLSNLIQEAKTNYNASDNTGATYRELMREVTAAEELLATWSFSADEISAAEKSLDDALDQMEVKKADTTKLQEAIASFEKLHAMEYTELSYKMVLQAVTEGKELLNKKNARQTRVDDATASILERIEMLIPSGYIAPPESDTDIVDGTDTGNESSSGTDSQILYEKGCKSIIFGSSALGILVLAGASAFVLKKKED